MSTTLREVTAYTAGRIVVERWPSERPLWVACAIVGGVVWLILTITVVPLVYALLVGVFFFSSHLLFVAHVRGNGVRLGPDQFPELHARVADIARRMDMTKVPDVYLMQAGGTLNAFATRFLRSNLVVLFAELLDACEGNEAARDMIIAHELGHLRAGHLQLRWLLAPALIVPFLSLALSRAREYTCDRFGAAAAGDVQGAQLGLAILAAGGKHGPDVNRRALAAQRQDLETGWMTIAEWLSTHPPLVKRLLALDPTLK